MTEEARVDRWLWAVRLYKTRTAAAEACRGGRVRVNGERARPASRLRTGDVVHAVVHGRPRVLEVVRAIDARVGAPAAATCLIDRSPPVPTEEGPPSVPRREPGTGRPTKRDRRRLDRFRNPAGG